MSLARYRAKRDFRKTSEPKAAPRGARRGKPLVFVVQEHHASHLHYDFRLEMKGVLKSWAIPKGPPRTPGIKRLAVMTEDHPYAYKDFEGVIPKGQYGGGRVKIWDRGTYELLKGSVSAGHFSFSLSGKKLKGAYALARLNGKNWVLMKAKAQSRG